MGEFICKIFAWPLVKFYELTGSYGLAVVFFALLVNLLMTPFMAKSKKSMMRSTRLQPRIQELQKRHEGNPQKLNAEMQKLYSEEGVNPMSGCLWSLIPFPILIALYSVIRRPLTRMMFVTQEVVDTLQDFFVTQGWYIIPEKADSYVEIKLAEIAHTHWDEVQSALAGKIDGLMNIDFTFLGINLGQQPEWNFFSHTDWSDPSVWAPALGLFLIPFISAGLSWLSMKISNMANPVDNAQAAASMKSMNIMMPLMSVWICFVMPAAMGIYWIANSLLQMIQELICAKILRKDYEAARVAAEEQARQAKEDEKRRKEEARLERARRAEEEKKNKKKKLPKPENAEPGVDPNDSKEGIRAHARGRSYSPNRYTVTDYTDPNLLLGQLAMSKKERKAAEKAEQEAKKAQAETKSETEAPKAE